MGLDEDVGRPELLDPEEVGESGQEKEDGGEDGQEVGHDHAGHQGELLHVLDGAQTLILRRARINVDRLAMDVSLHDLLTLLTQKSPKRRTVFPFPPSNHRGDSEVRSMRNRTAMF